VSGDTCTETRSVANQPYGIDCREVLTRTVAKANCEWDDWDDWVCQSDGNCKRTKKLISNVDNRTCTDETENGSCNYGTWGEASCTQTDNILTCTKTRSVNPSPSNLPCESSNKYKVTCEYNNPYIWECNNGVCVETTTASNTGVPESRFCNKITKPTSSPECTYSDWTNWVCDYNGKCSRTRNFKWSINKALCGDRNETDNCNYSAWSAWTSYPDKTSSIKKIRTRKPLTTNTSILSLCDKTYETQ
jgi:hypothetical protein